MELEGPDQRVTVQVDENGVLRELDLRWDAASRSLVVADCGTQFSGVVKQRRS